MINTNKTARRLLACLLIVLSVAMLFSACGKESESGQSDSPKETMSPSQEQTSAESNSPQASRKIKTVSVECRNSAAITDDGTLYIWGSTAEDVNSTKPVKLMENVMSVVHGFYNSAAIKENGELYVWGTTMYNCVPGVSPQELKTYTPTLVMENVICASIGFDNAAAVTKDGSLYVWGDGSISTGADKSVPEKIMDNIASVSIGSSYTLALTQDGELFAWGNNSEGQIGNGTKNTATSPEKIMDNVKAVATSAYGDHSAAITESGELYVWGNNNYGQVGNGSNEDALFPVKVLDDVIIADVGDYHTAAVTSDNSLYMWGGGYSKIAIENADKPTKVMDNVTDVSLGSHISAVIKDGSLYTWGNNSLCQLGYETNNSEDYSDTPQNVDFFE